MRSETTNEVLVGVDVGGTFTDFVVLRDGILQIYKLPTTPDDQSLAISAGFDDLSIRSAEVVHGMTVATNALLERRGASTALLATAGFSDVLVIGRQNRPDIYKLFQQRPPSLVADEWRLEVGGRIDQNGDIVLPLDEEGLQALIPQLAEGNIESLAIAFLFSFRNPIHEERTAELIRSLVPDLPISLSSDILPEYREYERTSTTVINAYVQPLVARYLTRLEQALAESTVRIMQSNGGAIGLRQASDQAARVVLSGPAGGVVGAFALAKQATGSGTPDIITFDMGGTSTDVALCPGEIPTTSESIITDLPLRLPVIDIHTVGAGGGSIAYIDAGCGLHVGPRSAGAVPGPACYGRGGLEPTVTDANLVLGRLDPGGFLGGKGAVTLDLNGATQTLTELGKELGLGAQEAALGVIQVANATMERALRRVSVERGYDPRSFTLVPFGGAGPLHACDLADAMGTPSILLPPAPGVLSAYGMLVADIASDASQSVLFDASDLFDEPQALAHLFDKLAERVATILHNEGISEPVIHSHLDMRYRGQSYELTVPLSLPVSTEQLCNAVSAFHNAHALRYGYAMSDEPVEVVTLRVRASGPGVQPNLPPAPLESADANEALRTEKPVWFDASEARPTPCYDRAKLRPGNRFAGPAIVLQFDTTTVITPGWAARVDEWHNMWLER
jgi:N-methylhydantoinase A